MTLIPAWIDGTLTPVEKLDAHRRGLRHKAVSIFILAHDKLLIQKRALHKYHTPGLWANTCCTHPHWDETNADCAYRRLSEELGIAGITLTARGHIQYRANVGHGLIENEDVAVFVAHVDDQLVVRPNPDEVMATRWISLSDLATEIDTRPAHFTPWLRIYMTDHKETIFA